MSVADNIKEQLGLDDDALATMTPEELAAINEGEHSEAELAALKSVAEEGDDDADDDDEADDDGDADAGAAPGASGAAPAAPPAAPAATSGEQEEEEAQPFRVSYKSDLPEDFESRVNAVQARAEELATKVRDGSMQFDEYVVEIGKVNAEKDELNTIRTRHELTQNLNQQSTQQEWEHTVSRFMAEAAKGGAVDYRNDQAKAADLDTFVKALAQDERNNDRSMMWFLREAHRRVMALHGLGVAAPATPPAAKPALSQDDAKKAAAARRKSPVGDLPATLAAVPGGDGPGDVGGEFADIDQLDGLEYEDALARMTPQQRERYLQA